MWVSNFLQDFAMVGEASCLGGHESYVQGLPSPVMLFRPQSSGQSQAQTVDRAASFPEFLKCSPGP